MSVNLWKSKLFFFCSLVNYDLPHETPASQSSLAKSQFYSGPQGLCHHTTNQYFSACCFSFGLFCHISFPDFNDLNGNYVPTDRLITAVLLCSKRMLMCYLLCYLKDRLMLLVLISKDLLSEHKFCTFSKYYV